LLLEALGLSPAKAVAERFAASGFNHTAPTPQTGKPKFDKEKKKNRSTTARGVRAGVGHSHEAFCIFVNRMQLSKEAKGAGRRK
jgi:hypothetical protein